MIDFKPSNAESFFTKESDKTYNIHVDPNDSEYQHFKQIRGHLLRFSIGPVRVTNDFHKRNLLKKKSQHAFWLAHKIHDIYQEHIGNDGSHLSDEQYVNNIKAIRNQSIQKSLTQLPNQTEREKISALTDYVTHTIHIGKV